MHVCTWPSTLPIEEPNGMVVEPGLDERFLNAVLPL
jgi:hypothetical protein